MLAQTVRDLQRGGACGRAGQDLDRRAAHAARTSVTEGSILSQQRKNITAKSRRTLRKSCPDSKPEACANYLIRKEGTCIETYCFGCVCFWRWSARPWQRPRKQRPKNRQPRNR